MAAVLGGIFLVIVVLIVGTFYGGLLLLSLFGTRQPRRYGNPGAPADNDPNEYQAH